MTAQMYLRDFPSANVSTEPGQHQAVDGTRPLIGMQNTI
jgi:hypothetical protein